MKVKSNIGASEWAKCYMGQYSDGNQTSANGDHVTSDNANGRNSSYNSTTTSHANGDLEHQPASSEPHVCESYIENRHGEELNYLHHREDFKQFVLPFKIPKKSHVTLSFVHEYLLERTDDAYAHTLSISPGERVEEFVIRLAIHENKPLKGLKLEIPTKGDVVKTLQQNEQPRSDAVAETDFYYNFNLTSEEQGMHFSQHGYTGDIKVSYDLEEGDTPFDLVAQDDFFVHFYSIPERTTMKGIPKSVLFLLDTSGEKHSVNTPGYYTHIIYLHAVRVGQIFLL